MMTFARNSYIQVGWETFKAVVALYDLKIRYIENDSKYIVYTSLDIIIETHVWKQGFNPDGNDIDALDFEANYKPIATGQNSIDELLQEFQSEDFAQESTQQSVLAELDNVQVSGVQIRDQAGNVMDTVTVSGITRAEARTSITGPGGGQDVAVTEDNNVNRLQTQTSIVGQSQGSGEDKKVTVINDTENPNTVRRLQVEALTAPGSIVNIGTAIPADPANLTISFLTTPGGSEDMLTNGGVTPVNFTYAPPAGVTVAVDSVLVVFTADDFSFDGASFGPNAALTNGTLFQIYTDGILTDLFSIRQNEDFLRIPGRIPVINNTGPKDLLSAAFVFGGLIKLHGDDGDYVRMVVRDNLTSTKFKYYTATMYGAEV